MILYTNLDLCTKISFFENYYPTQNIAIDEGLVPWRGNLHFRVYNPNKPHKFGMKSYQLCDETGYCTQYELYTGKKNNISEFGATYDVCMRLLQPYLGNGHNLFCDNYYTSPTLFHHLSQRHNTGACGTLRTNRKHVPKEVKSAKPLKGETFVTSHGDMNIIKYHDKRYVTMCTTLHNDIIVETNNVDHSTGDKKKRPLCIIDYNKFMGSVDRSDQMISSLNLNRRVMKWYKKVMFHLFDLAELQSYLLYRMRSAKPIPHRVYRRELIKQMLPTCKIPLDRHLGRKRSAGSISDTHRLEDRHLISKIEASPDLKKAAVQRNCKVCCTSMAKYYKAEGLKVPKHPGHMTRYECRDCQVSLCVDPCFKLYHTYQDYISAYRRYHGPLAAK